jgi:hypothetical protein
MPADEEAIAVLEQASEHLGLAVHAEHPEYGAGVTGDAASHLQRASALALVGIGLHLGHISETLDTIARDGISP